MPYQIQCSQQDNVVRVMHESTLRDADQGIQETATMLKKKGWHRVLLDVSTLTESPPLARQFELLSALTSALPHSSKFAMFVSHCPEMNSEFIETVAENRGLSLKVFFNLDEANVWLRMPSTA